MLNSPGDWDAQSGEDGPSSPLIGRRYEMGRGEVAHVVMSQAYFSKFSGTLALAAGAGAFLLLFIVLFFPAMAHTPFYLFMEIVLTITLLIDVACRILLKGNEFFRECMNIMDLLLVFFCVIVLLFSITTGNEALQGWKIGEMMVSDVLIICRAMIQGLRTLFFILRFKHTITVFVQSSITN